MRVSTRLPVWIMLACCGGCTALVPQRAAPPEGELPAEFSVGPASSPGENRWWEDFQSAALNGLVQEALAGNLTLRQLWARLDQAGSAAVKAASGLYPQLSLEGDVSYRRAVTTVEDNASPSFKSQLRDAVVSGVTRGITGGINQGLNGSTNCSTAGSGSTAGSMETSRSSLGGAQSSAGGASSDRMTLETKHFGLSLAASYEVDLWGRIASGYQAASLDFEATRDDLEATAITLAAEVADRWLRILEQQALERMLQQQLETNRTYLELVELRFRKNQATALDVYQQRQVVAAVERQMPMVQAQAQVLQHDLAVLLGRPPGGALEVGAYDLETVPPPPAAGIPAGLLANRPDVRAALARLEAADYRVAVARADRLPALRLTGGIGYSADDVAHVFNDWFVNLAGGLTAPLFDGFDREAEEQRTLAVAEERLAAYRLVVLTAIREVEDALVQETRQRELLTALNRELEAAQNAHREALDRYLKAANDYLPVLSALERAQLLTRAIVSARRELLIFRIDLYRALGGTWTQELTAPARLSEEDMLAEAG